MIREKGNKALEKVPSQKRWKPISEIGRTGRTPENQYLKGRALRIGQRFGRGLKVRTGN